MNRITQYLKNGRDQLAHFPCLISPPLISSSLTLQHQQPQRNSKTLHHTFNLIAPPIIAIYTASCIVFPLPTLASVPLAPSTPLQQQQLRALQQLGVRSNNLSTPSSKTSPVQISVREEIAAVTSLMAHAEHSMDDSDWNAAINDYTTIINEYSDLALAERARIHRALLLFQIGRSNDALLQLEDEEVILRGQPEVHAALAVVLYSSESPLQRARAEQQWDIATEFDGRYSDVQWVKANKKWPPRMLVALENFLTLS